MRGPRLFKKKNEKDEESILSLGLWQADGAATIFPQTAGLEDFDAFETLHHGALTFGATFELETAVLGHGRNRGIQVAGRRN